MKRKRNLKNFTKSDNAVSEILATVLLLGIAVSLFSILYVIVISSPVETPSPSVILVGSIKEQTITIDHHGGVALDLDTEILAIVGGAQQNVTTARDYLDISYMSNNKWDIGEKLVIDVEELADPSIDVTDLQIEVMVVDVESNSILLTGVLRKGEMISTVSLTTSVDAISPHEVIFSPTNITASGDPRLDNVTLWYRYSPDNSSWGSSASWWNNSWSYYRTIIIDHTKISENLVNFPVLVKINSTIGSKCDSGSSIRFIGTDNSTEYYYEIEKWDSSGDSYVWVNITSISSTADTTFLMYYNNSAASNNQNPSNVWDNFEAVYHLGEAYALDFDGSNDIVVGPSSNDITGDYLQTITFSAWVKHDDTGDNGYIASLKRQAGSPSTSIALDAGNTGPGNLGFLTRNYANTNHVWLNHNGGYNNGEWHHLVAVVNGLNRILYIDGIERNSDNEGIQNVSGNTAEFTIGGFHPTNMIGFDGSIDEVQIWNRSLSPSEINDLYHGKPVSRTRLVGEWLIDEGSGNDVSDSSSQGNDGDMSGHAASWIRSRAIDSTSNSNTGIREDSMAAAVDGKIDGADDFDGINDYIDCGDDASLDITGDLTIEAWVNADSVPSDYKFIAGKGKAGDENYDLRIWPDAQFVFLVRDSAGYYHANTGLSTTGSWLYLAGVFDSDSKEARIYADGKLKDTVSTAKSTLNTNNRPFSIGARFRSGAWGDFFNCNIDEVRISNRVRTASWINASYQNQNDISSFLTIESEQTEATGSGWIEWNNDSNPDTSSPWQWSFNFPNSTGYYEFYSIGKYNGDVEDAPESADVICYYNPSALLATSVDAISPYETEDLPLNITATGDSRLDNVTLWYRYSPNNSSWGNSASWWNNSWSYYRTIIIDHTKISENLVNFPVLVKINSTIGSKCDSGSSIRFIGTDNSTEYYYEIEKWDSSGDSYVWVNITSISSTADTTFLMYYNNSAASNNQNPSNVWDNFEAVYHLGEAYALDFDGSNDIVVGPSSNDITGDYLQTITFSAWVKHDDTGDNGYIASLKRQAGSPSTSIALDAGNTGPGNLGFLTRNYANTNHVWLNHNGGYNNGEWHHLVAVVNGLNRILYIDGIERNSDNEGIQNVSGNTAEFTIGGFHPTNMIGFDGSIDEVQIWNRSLSPSEINDLYHSKPVSRTRLVGEWLIDEGSGNDVSDSSSQGNDGDMSGHAASWIRSRAIDSTSNSNTGIREDSMAAAVDGKIDGADDFDGINDYIDCGDDASLDITGDLTIEAWVNADSVPSDYKFIAGKGKAGDENYDLRIWPDAQFVFLVRDSAGYYHANTGLSTTGSWLYLAGVFDSDSKEARIYADGELKDTVSTAKSTLNTNNRPFSIGARFRSGAWGDFFNCNIDEVRISNRVRTASWINASYQNQNDISSFLTIESEQSNTGEGSSWTSFSVDNSPPWQWNFNFPNITGYYEFYSIGKYKGDTEDAPENADAICYYSGGNELQGRQAQWHLNENTGSIAYDSVGNYNGTINSASWISGVSGSALSFNGTNNYVEFQNSNNFNLGNTLSFEVWVYPQEQKTAKIVQKGDWDGHGLGQDKWKGWKGSIYIDGDKKYSLAWNEGRPDLNTWYHLVLTYDGSYIRLYINGTEVDNETVSGNLRVNSRNIFIGSDGGAQKFFNGIIDEVTIYNRAISANEILNRYNTLKP